MKSSELLEEIKISIQEYDINKIKAKLEDDEINPISKQVSIFNLENYDEIMAKTIEKGMDDEISNDQIESMKNEIDLFFKGCSPESEESFKKFVESICLYLSLIAKKPLHPVGIDFGDEETVHEDIRDNKTVYICDKKEFFKNQSKDYCTCNYCVCESE